MATQLVDGHHVANLGVLERSSGSREALQADLVKNGRLMFANVTY